jgi:hypothetical protein
MTHFVLAHTKDGHRIAKVTQSITIDVASDRVWAKISNITGLAEWVEGVKKTTHISKKRRGLGASRKILFDDGEQVTEYIVGWEDGKYLSYIATEGLPLDGYHATLSILQSGKSTRLTWESILVSEGSNDTKFSEFLAFIDSFYKNSLVNLKCKLEKTT